MNTEKRHYTGQPGIGVDSAGGAVIDPTANVLQLVEASITRLDDLRKADARRLEEILTQETRRVDDLRAAESRRVDEQLVLRAEYTERLTTAEAKRIDAVRAIDVNAVAVASQRAADQAQVLANQVVQSAEALRTLVASTAAAVAASQQQLAQTLSARITSLEQSQYEGKGKSAMADPQLIELMREIKSLRLDQTLGVGKSAGSTAMWGYVVGAIGLISVILSILSRL